MLQVSVSVSYLSFFFRFLPPPKKKIFSIPFALPFHCFQLANFVTILSTAYAPSFLSSKPGLGLAGADVLCSVARQACLVSSLHFPR